MSVIQYGKEYKKDKTDEIQVTFIQNERKLCPNCNAALYIHINICPNCGYVFSIDEEDSEK